MAGFEPIYRLTIYESRETDINEDTPLVPVAGGQHTDDFEIATATGITGFQPYLDTVIGARGEFDPLTRRVSTGKLTCRIIDKRTGTNAQRWVTEFVGGADKRVQFIGLRAVAQVDYGDGAGLETLFTGRVYAARLVEKNAFEFELRDIADDAARLHIFGGVPASTVSYAIPSVLLPRGFVSAVGLWGPFRETFPTKFLTHGTQTDRAFLIPDPAEAESKYLVSDGLKPLLTTGFDAETGVLHFPPWQRKKIRVRMKHLGGAQNGNTGTYELDWWGTKSLATGQELFSSLTVETIRKDDGSPDTGHAEYLAAPVATVPVEVHMISNTAPTKERPLFIDDIHPAALLRDFADGEFSRLDASGSPLFKLPYNASAFTSLIADTSFGLFRGKITGEEEMLKFAEEQICQPFGLGFYFDETGTLQPFDARLPTTGTVGSPPSLVEADLVSDAKESWEISTQSALTGMRVTFYEDRPNNPLDPQHLDEIEHTLEVRDFAREATIGEQLFEIDAKGLRFGTGEQVQSLFAGIHEETSEGDHKRAALEAFVERLVSDFRSPFSVGGIFVTARCRRTTNVVNCKVGDWRSVNFDALPNPAANERGGARLFRCIGVEEEIDSPSVRLTFLDSGLDAIEAAPTLGALALVSGRGKHECQTAVTLNGNSAPVALEYVLTDTSVGTRPGDSDPGWRRRGIARSSTTWLFRHLPAGRRVWVRGRSEPESGDEFKLPSAWVYPSGTGRVDLTALTAPSALGSSVSGGVIGLDWTLGETGEEDGSVEVFNETPQPAGDPTEYVTTLSPNSAETTLYVDQGSTAYKAGVRHRDAYGGVSAMATHNYTSGALNAAPDMGAAPTLIIGIQA